MNEFHARIEPVDEDLPRPLWSVLIPCYNCARFLELTLNSVLAQDPGPGRMEIIVIDDCSTRDNPEEVVERLARGRVRFIRQKRNVGKVRNYETGLTMSRGQLIHQLHGDDLVLPGFYAAMDEAFEAHAEAGAFFCSVDYIDENGAITGHSGSMLEKTGLVPEFLRKIAAAQLIQTPSMVVRREVYEKLGGFDRRLDCCEDWEMWTRIGTTFPVGFCVEAQAQYRSSTSNSSNRGILSGTLGAVQREMFRIVDGYLPLAVVESAKDARNLSQAYYFAQNIPEVLRESGIKSWLKLCREVFRFSKRPEIIRRIVSLTFRTWLR
jgi:GT2 family glycosyltransferase